MPNQLFALVSASRKTKAKFYLPALIFLAAEHGTSKQEALSLTWDKINFDYNGTGIIWFHRTKNGKDRTDYLMPYSKKALQEWQAHQRWMRKRKKIDHNGSTFVFSHLNGVLSRDLKVHGNQL